MSSETGAREGLIAEILEAIVDPQWVRARIAFLSTLAETAGRFDAELPARPPPLSDAELEDLVVRGLEGRVANTGFPERLRGIVDDASMLRRLHDGIWANEAPASEWRGAIDRLVARRHPTLRRLVQLAKRVSGHLGSRAQRVMDLLEETYARPVPELAVYGRFEHLLLSPAGRTRLPVRFTWNAEPGVTYDLTVYRDKENFEEVRIAQIEDVRTPFVWHGPESRPLEAGSYSCELVSSANPGERPARRAFEVVDERELSRVEPVLDEVCGDPVTRARLWATALEAYEIHCEAAEAYAEVYAATPEANVGARIVSCYEALELDGLAASWAERVRGEERA